MKISKLTSSYLNGNEFSDGFELSIPEYYETKSRIDTIRDIVSKKSIIHLGCCDHVPLIEEKIKANQWLHKIITVASAETLGIDINYEGITYVKESLGFKNVVWADITSNDNIEEIKEKKWDILVLGEILEHVDNPVLFLQQIKAKYGDCIDEIVITVPNIMSLQYGRKMYERIELINSDHKYWFTPYTISKVVQSSGIIVTELKFADAYLRNNVFYNKIYNKYYLKNKYPFYYFSTMICIGKFK